MLKKYCLSKVKTPYEQFLIFLNFMNTFSKPFADVLENRRS